MSFSSLLLLACRRHADRHALWVGGATLTYAEMERAGGSVLPPSIGASGVVAIIAERKAATYVAIHACMIRDVCYVPINPRWPIGRIKSILDAARADAVLVDSGEPASAVAAELLGAGEYDVWRLGTEIGGAAELLGPARGSGRARRYAHDDLAYIMFTSGSTGLPKGVPILGKSVAHYVGALKAIAAFDESDRIIQNVELTFDLSVHDMALCWSSGAMLIVVPEGNAPLGPRFVKKLEATSWLSVPSAAAQSKNLGLLKPGGMPSLRTSFFCGEALPASLAETWQAAAVNSRLWNIYGPTEATIAFSSFEVESAAADRAIVPLGFPIGGQEMMLEEGSDEILLSGPQLSPGYLDDPERTAKAFIEREGKRWYRTGDRGSFDAVDGYLYRGRLDAQIKLRGYRVELGDIEAAMRKRSGTDLVAAIAVREVGPTTYEGLVGVICGGAEDLDRVRASLRLELPEYMVPERLVAVGAMPKNANDKVDYLALRTMIEHDK